MTEVVRKILATLITPSVLAALLSHGFTGGMYLYTFVIVYFTIFILTLPIYVHLNRMKGLKPAPIIFGTFVVGIFAGIVFVLFNFAEGVSYDHTRALEGATPISAGTGYEFINIMFTGLLGASAGFIWWVIARAGISSPENDN